MAFIRSRTNPITGTVSCQELESYRPGPGMKPRHRILRSWSEYRPPHPVGEVQAYLHMHRYAELQMQVRAEIGAEIEAEQNKPSNFDVWCKEQNLTLAKGEDGVPITKPNDPQYVAPELEKAWEPRVIEDALDREQAAQKAAASSESADATAAPESGNSAAEGTSSSGQTGAEGTAT